MEEKNIFIWLLEYGEQESHLTLHDVLEQAQKDQTIYSVNDPAAAAITELFKECFSVNNQALSSDHCNYTLKGEYRSRLIEYRELQLAREAADSANENAKAARKQSDRAFHQAEKAFRFSVIAVIISVTFSLAATLFQSMQPIKLDSKQLEELTQVIKQAHSNQAHNPTAKLNRQTPAAIANKTPQKTSGDAVKAHAE